MVQLAGIKSTFAPAQEKSVLNAYAQYKFLNVHKQQSIRVKDLWLGKSLNLHPCIVYASSESSDETAHIRSLVWAFAGRMCDK